MILSNLLTVPVEESLLYVQPIFVQGSAPNSFPLLQKVAVFYNDKVGYATNLADAIREVVSGEQPTEPPPEDGGAQPPPPPSGGGDESVQGLLTQANQAYEDAQRALADGDLAEYQHHIDDMAQPSPTGPGRRRTAPPPQPPQPLAFARRAVLPSPPHRGVEQSGSSLGS